LSRKVSRAAASEVLIRHVRDTLKGFEQVKAKIEEPKGLRHAEITLAIMSGLAGNRDQPACQDSAAAVADWREIMTVVASAEADLGLGSSSLPIRTCECSALRPAASAQ
jgi:hypothetical protein